MTCKLSRTDEYKGFRATIPLKKICVDDNIENEWYIHETGSKLKSTPIICLPPISGNADVFYKQHLALSAAGYRVLSVDYAVHWSCQEFCVGFKRLLDHFNFSKVHLLGASLGGFLAQKFAESFPDRVESLILCNTFSDTGIFEKSKAISACWLLPLFVLQRMISKNLKSQSPDQDIQDSIEFALESLKSLGQKQLASRLTLNCLESSVNSELVGHLPMTIVNTVDQSALSLKVQQEFVQKYPKAWEITLQTGGNFPYLSRTVDFNTAVVTHLKQLERLEGEPQMEPLNPGQPITAHLIQTLPSIG